MHGMINNPNIQPNVAMNHWIAAILLFDFKLVHIPADKHTGPDGLSRRPPLEGEDEDEGDPEDWVDEVLGLGVWVASWVAAAAQTQTMAVAVLGVETRAMAARRRTEEGKNERQGDTDSGQATVSAQKQGQQGDKDSGR